MIGYYYKVINENNCCVIVGLNNMIWYYDKDLSGYLLGQGGYYSLQEYLLFVVLVMWWQCMENWLWELGGLVFWLYFCNCIMLCYLLMNLILVDYQEDVCDQINGGGSSQGFGYIVWVFIECWVIVNWFVGMVVDIQQVKDYIFSYLLLYVCYFVVGWQGDMDLLLQFLVFYVDW